MEGILRGRARALAPCLVGSTSVGVWLSTGGTAGNWIEPGNEANLQIKVANPSAGTLTVTFVATVTELDGTISDISTTLSSMAAQSVSSVAVPLGLGRYGARRIAYTATFSGGVVTGTLGFVYAPQAGLATDPTGFRWGMITGFTSFGDDIADYVLEANEYIGVTTVRWGREWPDVEPTDGVYDWERVDARIEQANAYGFESQYLIAYSNPFAASPAAQAAYALAVANAEPSPERWLTRTMPNLTMWREYVSSLVTHIAARGVNTYEIWNEPNVSVFWLGTTDEYLALLQAGFEECKLANPTGTVFSGGFASLLPNLYTGLNPDIYVRTLAEASQYFDVLAHHEHGSVREMNLSMNQLDVMRAGANAEHPVYLNEAGKTASKNQERDQAWQLVKKIATAQARGVVGYNWYRFVDQRDLPTDDEATYGMWDFYFQPRYAYGAYNGLVLRLRGKSFQQEIVAPGMGMHQHILVFQGVSTRRCAVVWSDTTTMPDAPVALNVGYGANVYDIHGNELIGVMPYAGGIMTLLWDDEPYYVEFDSAPTVAATPDPSAVVTALRPASRVSAANVITSGGKVVRFNDTGTLGGYFEQLDTTKQIATPNATGLAGKPLASFGGFMFYPSSLPIASWNFLHHQATPRDLFLWLKIDPIEAANQRVWQTALGSPNGAWVEVIATTGRIRYNFAGSSGGAFGLSSAATGYTLGSNVGVHFRYDPTLSPDARLFDYLTSVANGNYVGTSATDAAMTLQIGRNVADSKFSFGEWAMFDRRLTEWERNAMLYYGQANYSVPGARIGGLLSGTAEAAATLYIEETGEEAEVGDIVTLYARPGTTFYDGVVIILPGGTEVELSTVHIRAVMRGDITTYDPAKQL